MENIVYLKDVPFVKKLFGFIILILGIISILSSNVIFGVIFLFIGTNLISTEGAELNFIDKKYRLIKSVFGINVGKWQNCPEFEYVSVFKTKENQTIRVISAEANLQSEVILLNLFYQKNKHITFYKTNDKLDAFKVAEHFKLVFGIDILDATEKDKKWL